MPVRLLIGDEVVCEGETMPIPRVGELIVRDGQTMPVEAVTWDFHKGDDVTVTLLLGDRPYTY